MSTADVQYVSDERGDLTARVVPIALWKEIVSEFETQYLLKSETMKKRLFEGTGKPEPLKHEMKGCWSREGISGERLSHLPQICPRS